MDPTSTDRDSGLSAVAVLSADADRRSDQVDLTPALVEWPSAVPEAEPAVVDSEAKELDTEPEQGDRSPGGMALPVNTADVRLRARARECLPGPWSGHFG